MARRIVAFCLGLLLLTGFLPQVSLAEVTPGAESAPAPVAPPAKKPAVGGELRLGLAKEPDSFNPIISGTAYGQTIISLVHATLFDYNEKWEVVPNLAESWQVAADGVTWTIQLRRGVLFQNGVELTADDVVFTYQSVMDPGYTGPRRASVTSMKAISAPDRYTVRVEFKEALAAPYSALNLGILSRQEFAGIAVKDFASFNPWFLTGAGPYKVIEYDRGRRVVLERNPAYFRSAELGGAPFIRRITYLIIPEPDIMTGAFYYGAIDMLTLDAGQVTDAVRAQAFPVEYERNGWGYFSLNTERPHVNNKLVRQALTYGLDRRLIARRIFGERATVPAGPIPAVSWAFDPTLKPLPYDAVKAMQLLEQAGYKLNGDGYYEKDGQVLELTLGLSAGSSLLNSVGYYTPRYFDLIGVKLNVKFLDFNTLMEKANRGELDMIFSGFSLALDPDQTAIFHSSQVTGGFNRMRYRNPEVDRLLEAGRREPDMAKRKEIYTQFQRIIIDDAPVILLYSNVYTDWISKRVKGGVVNFPGTGATHIERWWIEEQ